jgi:hypothetical protein
VEIPVVKQAEIRCLQAALRQTQALMAKVKSLGAPLDQASRNLNSSINTLLAVDSEKFLEKAERKLRSVAAAPVKSAVAQVPAPPRPKPVAAPKLVAKPVEKPAPIDGEDIPLNKPQLRMLGALGSFETIRHEPVPRSWIAAWRGIKVSGSFMNNLGGLRTRG